MAEEQTQPVEQTQEQPVQQENVSNETQEATTTEPSPRPEYVPEKFWNVDKGEINMEEFGKSYTNLEKYVGGKKEELREQIVDELQQEAIAERPEKVEGYELPKLPEGVTEEIVNANPMTDWWKNFCYENAYDQETFEEGVNKYVDMYMGNQVDVDAEKEKLGENADARLDAVNNWASTFFTPEQYEAISGSLGQSVDGIEALEKMMNANKQTISNAQNFTQPERPLTLEDVRSMMKDKRYFDPKERDESYVRKVDDAFARLYRG
ncbi:hypothetical protein EXVC032PBaldr_006 [Pelagibacter phage EXVC031P Hodr]|jgi:hypothetical protein|nr:hypothetical protein EXVC032PBaldr_006 [Pelagibacter phage EXVC031P Hodr]